LYRLPVFPLGTYTLAVDAGAFAAHKQSGIQLNAGTTATIDVTLQVKGVASEVVVTAAAPTIDSSRARSRQHAVVQCGTQSPARIPSEFGVPLAARWQQQRPKATAPEFVCCRFHKRGFQKFRSLTTASRPALLGESRPTPEVNFDTFFGDAADPCEARPSGAGSRAACDVRASGGVFYDPFQTDQYRRAILVNGSPAFFRLPVTPRQAFAPSFPNVLTGIPPGATSTNFGIATVNPDFASPYRAMQTYRSPARLLRI
jgi:hypothetical protein